MFGEFAFTTSVELSQNWVGYVLSQVLQSTLTNCCERRPISSKSHGTPLIQTLMGWKKVSSLVRCPHFEVERMIFEVVNVLFGSSFQGPGIYHSLCHWPLY